jgi:Pyruvate/2-oxoacid:ferredoxin oxidoreductase delta subunit
LLRLWSLGKIPHWLGNLPLIGPLFAPCFRPEESEAFIIPVQQAIQGTESVALPYTLLPFLTRQASARFILDKCSCRHAEHCRDYPHDIGCLFLGDGAAQIHPQLGRQASADEALAHLDRAVSSGLVPMVAHASFDAYMLDIPYRKMLAICFCCDCCCTIRQGLRMGPVAFWDTVQRLPGLKVVVETACTGCGTCLAKCPVNAISAPDGRAYIDHQRCKGCGLCIAACPDEAIHLHLADGVDTLDRLLARIGERTDIFSCHRTVTRCH